MATDYARLAKRISSITTDCLLTAVVLVAGLGFGRQVLRWWAAEPAEPAAAPRPVEPADGLGDPSRLHVFQFGDQPWSLRRQSVSGGRQAAAAALRANCREVVRGGRLPDGKPGEAEGKLLSRLAATDPAEQEPGKWRLYELQGAFPMTVGTRPRAAAGHRPGKNLAPPGHRVVVWGMALPTGPDAWAVVSFQPEVAPGRRAAPLQEAHVPPECRRTLSVQVAGGGAMLAFEGPQSAKSYISYYDRWFAAHNWRKAGAWERFGAAWHARYVPPGEAPTGSVDVHLSSDGLGRCTGLLMTTPGNTQPR